MKDTKSEIAEKNITLCFIILTCITGMFFILFIAVLRICNILARSSICVRYFPKAFSSYATSKMCNFPGGNFPKVKFGPLRRRRVSLGPNAATRMGKGVEHRG